MREECLVAKKIGISGHIPGSYTHLRYEDYVDDYEDDTVDDFDGEQE